MAINIYLKHRAMVLKSQFKEFGRFKKNRTASSLPSKEKEKKERPC